jgi:hypothetical protein
LAITLRKNGHSYNEILKLVPVAKSTLSLWLRDVGLNKSQQQHFSEKKRQAQLRGGAARHVDRLERTTIVINEAKKSVGTLTHRELLLIGAALYWAEGAKEKTYRPSVRLDFTNSDPDMIRLYVHWLRKVLLVDESDIVQILHIHKNRKSDIEVFTKFWLQVTGLKPENCAKPIIKQHNPKTIRKNVDDTYHGLVAIRVRRSIMLNRRVQGYIRGIVESS